MSLAVSFIVFHKKAIKYTLKCGNFCNYVLTINIHVYQCDNV